MSEQATGVTEGNDETQSPIRTPRRIRAAKLGARSSAIARSSMSVRRESTTTRQSFREPDMRCEFDDRDGCSPEHPQALVLLLGAAAAGGGQPQEGEQEEEAERLEDEGRENRDDHGDPRDDQADRRGSAGAGLGAGDDGADDSEGDHRDDRPERDPRPGRMVAVVQGDREEDRARHRGADREQHTDQIATPRGAREGPGRDREPDALTGGEEQAHERREARASPCARLRSGAPAKASNDEASGAKVTRAVAAGELHRDPAVRRDVQLRVAVEVRALRMDDDPTEVLEGEVQDVAAGGLRRRPPTLRSPDERARPEVPSAHRAASGRGRASGRVGPSEARRPRVDLAEWGGAPR